MNQFRHIDTKRANGCYVTFERIEQHDATATPRDYLFQDEDYREQDQARLDAWKNDKWHFIGIQAKAHITLVRNGVATSHELTSGGLWAIESDSDETYLAEVYEEEKAALMDDIRAMSAPVEV
jgi:hypothetical protein